MKKIITIIGFLAFSTFAISAEDGTGQMKSSGPYNNELFAYCSLVIKAEDGTGQGKAEDGTGQGKAEDGTGQDKSSHPMIGFCSQVVK